MGTAAAAEYSYPADIFYGLCYTTCSLFGFPTNIASLAYYLSEPATIPTSLYRLIAANDMIISLLPVPIIHAMLNNRHSPLLEDKIGCAVWGMMLKFHTYFSIFLVWVMSSYRTYTLAFPVKKVKFSVVASIVGVGGVLLICSQVLPIATSNTTFKYTLPEAYCWDYAGGGYYDKIDTIIDTVLLIAPFTFITINCIASILLVHVRKVITMTIKGTRRPSSASNAHLQRASVTIIIFTAVYIACNVPITILYVFYTLSYDTYPEPYFTGNIFMLSYIWNLFEVFTVCLNSAVNPVIYYTRNSRFKMKIISTFSYN